MAQKEKKKSNKKIWLLVILISILLIPALYSGLYLKSYWNDGTNFNKVPIAVVNLDQSYTKDGVKYDVGDTIINSLKSNNTLGWKFVSYKQAEEGLYGTKYYAMLVIPKDFSEKIANATTDGFKKPEIEFYQNQGKNFVFSEISGFGAQEIQQTVAQSISRSVSNVLVQTIYKTKDGFKSAANGADQLDSGLVQLKNGTSSLSTGMDKLQSGSGELVNGVDKLQNGSGQLVNGVSKLQDGSDGLTNGVNKLQNGSDALVDGVSKLQDGSDKLASGVDKLQSGSDKLVTGTNELQTGSQGLVNGMQKLSNGAQGLKQGANKLEVGANNLSDGMQKLNSGATQIAEGEQGISEEVKELSLLISKGDTQGAEALSQKIAAQTEALQAGANALKDGISNAGNGASQLNDGLAQLSNGISSLNDGIDNAASGANKLNNGINSVAQGANALNSGLVSAKTGANALNSGVNSVYTGVNALNSGLESAKTGANALSSGINSIYTGASALNSGIGTVSNGVSGLNNGISSAASGANKVNNGLESAKTGAEQLSAGLNSGYNNLNDNVKFSANDMSNFIANPITLKTIAINPVDSYGEGFAPYFMCIGLWVGAMYAYFVISALSRKFEGSFKKRFIKSFSIGAGICAIQAIIMSSVLYFGLDLNIQHVGLFFLVNILTIVAVYSLFNGLHYIITPLMKGAIMILMLFEFTSCGGSYPIAMMPAFYRVVSKFAILTYGVGGMRMAISGINNSVFNKYITVLILCIVIPTIIGFIVGYVRNHITHKRVLKEKSELVSEEELFNQYV